MIKRKRKSKYVYKVPSMATLEAILIAGDPSWIPYLNIEDVRNLDNVREVRQKDDSESAAKCGLILA